MHNSLRLRISGAGGAGRQAVASWPRGEQM